MKRQSRSRNIQLLGNYAWRESVRPALDQQAEHGKSGFLSKGAQRFNYVNLFHISRYIELMIVRQVRPRLKIQLITCLQHDYHCKANIWSTMGAMIETDLTLYELAGANPNLRFSPHCWKVLMALAHKGLTAKRVPLRFTDRDSIAFSGQSLVPVLVDGTEAVSDSWRIALHLEDRFPALPSLFGNHSAVLVTRFVNSWADTVLLAAMARVILVDVYKCLDADDQSYFRTSREKYFGMPLEAVVADQPSRLTDLRKVLLPVRHVLKKQAFIGGEAPTYADYCVFGMFMWARSCSEVELLEAEDPVAVWCDRLLEAFDGVARSAPSI